jgi:hypothetical protein
MTRLRCATLLGIACALVSLSSTRASAGVVFYTSEAAFDAAAPALQTQTFASAKVDSTLGVSIIANPLDSATNNAVFSAGSILPGLTIASSASHSGQDLGVVAPTVFGNPNIAVYNNFGGDSLLTSFVPPVTAVGMGLLNPNGTTVTFSVKGPGGSPLGSQDVTVNSAGPPTFFGVIATGGDQIGQIELLGQPTNGDASQRFAGIDRIVFGTASVPEPAGIILLGIGVVLPTALGRRGQGRRTGRGGAGYPEPRPEALV